MGAFLTGSFLTAAGPVLFLTQLACLVHLIRTGRPYWWIFPILGFPLLGMAAYVLLEVQPSFRKIDLQTMLWSLRSPSDRIAILERQCEESPTVSNRLALAEELHGANHFDRECAVLNAGLRGAFRDDPQLLTKLAEAHLEAGRPDDAGDLLARTVPGPAAEGQFQHSLLRARVLGAQGNDDEAESLFLDLIASKKSEAPRFYYAEFLLGRSRQEEAVAILKDILRMYRRGTPVWRHTEKKSFYAARHLLKSRALG